LKWKLKKPLPWRLDVDLHLKFNNSKYTNYVFHSIYDEKIEWTLYHMDKDWICLGIGRGTSVIACIFFSHFGYLGKIKVLVSEKKNFDLPNTRRLEDLLLLSVTIDIPPLVSRLSTGIEFLYQVTLLGGSGDSSALHVRLISLRCWTRTSRSPRMLALETEIMNQFLENIRQKYLLYFKVTQKKMLAASTRGCLPSQYIRIFTIFWKKVLIFWFTVKILWFGDLFWLTYFLLSENFNWSTFCFKFFLILIFSYYWIFKQQAIDAWHYDLFYQLFLKHKKFLIFMNKFKHEFTEI